MKTSISLKDKVALVTGASGGIGSAIAHSLAEEGCSLILCGRNLKKLEKLAADLKSLTESEVVPCAFDLGNWQECESALQSLGKLGEKVQFLVNSAGVGLGLTHFQEARFEEIEKLVRTNLLGFLNITRALLPRMIENQPAHIVNIGSVGGKLPSPRNVPYNASKSAMLAATESLRIDLMGHRVRVTIVEPGLVMTEMSQQGRFENKEKAEVLYRGVELLQPEDIADAVLWSLTRPLRVNVQEIVVYPSDQASVGYLHRSRK